LNLLKNAGKKCWKNPKNPEFGFFNAGKIKKNPKNPLFGFFLLENAGKNPAKDFLSFFQHFFYYCI